MDSQAPPPAYVRTTSEVSSTTSSEKVMVRFLWPTHEEHKSVRSHPTLLVKILFFTDRLCDLEQQVAEIYSKEVEEIKIADAAKLGRYHEDKYSFVSITPHGEKQKFEPQNWRLTPKLLRYGCDVHIKLTPAYVNWERKARMRYTALMGVYAVVALCILAILGVVGTNFLSAIMGHPGEKRT